MKVGTRVRVISLNPFEEMDGTGPLIGDCGIIEGIHPRLFNIVKFPGKTNLHSGQNMDQEAEQNLWYINDKHLEEIPE